MRIMCTYCRFFLSVSIKPLDFFFFQLSNCLPLLCNNGGEMISNWFGNNFSSCPSWKRQDTKIGLKVSESLRGSNESPYGHTHRFMYITLSLDSNSFFLSSFLFPSTLPQSVSPNLKWYHSILQKHYFFYVLNNHLYFRIFLQVAILYPSRAFGFNGPEDT